MAAKNSIKIYRENSFYHLYNRGVEKRDIFVDPQDFAVFLSYLKTYLLPKNEAELHKILSSHESSYREKQKVLKELALKNFAGEIDLLSYALLPNHFHLLIKQEKADGIDRFINALGARYTGYFNRKYRRVGPLFQSVYKAVLVQTDEQLLHLSRYIHLNPFVKLSLPVSRWQKIPWPFSLPDYFGAQKTTWVGSGFVLDYFRKSNPNNSYESFMGENIDLAPVVPLAIDYDSE